jgi:ABC-type uncharacterized transport system auxiliary subunit
MRRVGWLLVPFTIIGGCLFRNTSVPPRYFAPGSAAIEPGADDPVVHAGASVPIQLRSVHGTALLREHVVWRVSPVEYGQYGERLWSELPATYVQRTLANALRRTPGLRLTDEVRAASLRVEVLEFEEVLAPTHTADVSLSASLRDAKGANVLDRTFSAAAPIAGDDPEQMAQAMGRALDEATSAVAAAVASALHAH